MIQDESLVSIEYTLTVDGAVLDSNVGGEPLVYRQGKHEVLQALEDGLEGRVAGDEVEIDISAEEGYGPVEAELFEIVPVDVIPPEDRQVGTELDLEGDDGQILQVTVHAVDAEGVTLDLNHPLAGRDLHFSVKILKVE